MTIKTRKIRWVETNMTSKELNKLLIETFPELNDSYIEEVKWQEGDDTGSHTVYGDIFTPYIIICIENNKQEEIRKIFSYVEFLLSKKDSYIEEVIAFSVLESIEYLLKCNKKIQFLPGYNTLKVLEEL